MEDSSSSEDGAETDTTIEMDEKGNKLKLRSILYCFFKDSVRRSMTFAFSNR